MKHKISELLNQNFSKNELLIRMNFIKEFFEHCMNFLNAAGIFWTSQEFLKATGIFLSAQQFLNATNELRVLYAAFLKSGLPVESTQKD